MSEQEITKDSVKEMGDRFVEYLRTLEGREFACETLGWGAYGQYDIRKPECVGCRFNTSCMAVKLGLTPIVIEAPVKRSKRAAKVAGDRNPWTVDHQKRAWGIFLEALDADRRRSVGGFSILLVTEDLDVIAGFQHVLEAVKEMQGTASVPVEPTMEQLVAYAVGRVAQVQPEAGTIIYTPKTLRDALKTMMSSITDEQ